MIKKVHHIGIAVADLAASLGFYRDVLGLPFHKEAEVKEQGVRAALLLAGESEIELLEPTAPETPVGRFLARRGGGLHHICFEVEDVAAELAALKARGVELVDQEPRQGLAGIIAFLHPRAHRGVLVELARPPQEERHAAPSPLVRRLRYVLIGAEDPADALARYEANLGLRAAASGDGPAGQVTVGESLLLVLTAEEARPHLPVGTEAGEGLLALGLEVGDLEAAVEHLRQRGVEVSAPAPGILPGTRAASVAPAASHGVPLHLVGT
ncbi:hypothetical protein HRbin25_00055 [bacterium HR25]|nr:hypothetical protein HRbin25_00055 [bacterium HR25]